MRMNNIFSIFFFLNNVEFEPVNGDVSMTHKEKGSELDKKKREVSLDKKKREVSLDKKKRK